MHPGHLAHRLAYMKTDIPVAGCAHQAKLEYDFALPD
jgi:hypothetical protein